MADELPTGLGTALAGMRALSSEADDSRNRARQIQYQAAQDALPPDATLDQRVQTALPFLSPHETAQYGLSNQAKNQALAATLLHHNELIDVARERNQIVRDNNLARVKDKEAQDAILNGFKETDRKLAQQKLDNEKMLREMGLQIQQQNADTNAARVQQQVQNKDQPLSDFMDKIDSTIRMINENPGVTGGGGMINRLGEFVGSTITPGTPTPANDFQTKIKDLQTTYRGLPGHAASRLKIDAANIDKTIQGLGLLTSDTTAVNSLTELRNIIARQLQNRGSATEAAPEVPSFPSAPPSAKDRKANTVYMTPRGPLKWTGTGWVPK